MEVQGVQRNRQKEIIIHQQKSNKKMEENNNYEIEKMKERRKAKLLVILTVAGAILLFIAIVVAMFLGLPRYNVWRSELKGKAEFVRAEQNRQIKIEEAKANLEAEKLNAKAEVERAKGAAEAIKIENGQLTTTYIQYLWVRQQSNNQIQKIVYIPTEASMPILEAAGHEQKGGD